MSFAPSGVNLRQKLGSNIRSRSKEIICDKNTHLSHARPNLSADFPISSSKDFPISVYYLELGVSGGATLTMLRQVDVA